MIPLYLRRRGVWEAVDSGILIWRSNFFYFIPFFILPFVTIAFGLRFLPANYTYLSYLVLWWLKPFFDRLLLHVVSRRFFGNKLNYNLRQTLWPGLFGDLLWRRFNLMRAGELPIRVLEGGDSKQFRQRKTALGSRGLNFCPAISLLCFAMELILLFGELVFVSMILQIFFPSVFSNLWVNFLLTENFIFIFFCINFILVESLYLCMGFGLYINSRSEFEGWDLQLLFKKLSNVSSKQSKIAVLLCCIFLTGFFLLPPNKAFAAERIDYFPENFPGINTESLAVLEEVLASRDFGAERDGWGIRLRRTPGATDIPDIDFFPIMERTRQIFGVILRLIVILVSIGFLSFVFYWVWKNKQSFFKPATVQKNIFQKTFLTAENPESFFARAEIFFQQGKIREAWAVCFEGCLGAFAWNGDISFPAGATEYDCLNLVRQAKPGASETFEALVKNWVLFAYGGREPCHETFKTALSYGRSILKEAVE